MSIEKAKERILEVFPSLCADTIVFNEDPAYFHLDLLLPLLAKNLAKDLIYLELTRDGSYLVATTKCGAGRGEHLYRVGFILSEFLATRIEDYYERQGEGIKASLDWADPLTHVTFDQIICFTPPPSVVELNILVRLKSIEYKFTHDKKNCSVRSTWTNQSDDYPF